MRWRWTVYRLAILAALVPAACRDTSPRLARLEIYPSILVLNSLEEINPLVIQAYDAEGNRITPPKLAWASSDETVVLVKADGTLAPQRVGEAVVTAAAGRVKSSVVVEIQPVFALETSRTHAAVAAGSRIRFQVIPTDRLGSPIEVPLIWTSSDESIATVDEFGIIAGVSPGEATITVTAQQLAMELEVVVTDPVRVADATAPSRPQE